MENHSSIIRRAKGKLNDLFMPQAPTAPAIDPNLVLDELRSLRALVEGMGSISADHEYKTLAETAAHLRISDRQLNQIRREAEVPQPVTLGGKQLYTRDQLDAIKRRLHILAGFVG